MSTEKAKEKTKEALEKVRKHNSGFRKEFSDFINRGNVMDLAVGVVIGSAFTAIVNSVVNDIIMPIVSLVGGGFDFTNLSVTIPNFFTGEAGAVINYGNFIQNVVNFLILALVVFLIVKLINRMREKAEKLKKKEEAAAEKAEEEKIEENTALLREILAEIKKKK